MIKRISRVLCIVLIVGLTAGCAKEEPKQSENETVEAEDKETAQRKALNQINPSAYGNTYGVDLEPGSYISIIGRASGGGYWEEIKKGAEKAVQEINENLGYEGSDKVKLVYSGPGKKGDVEEQINILDEELARYPSAIAISLSDCVAFEVQFDLAMENDIPIVTFDSGSDYKGVMANIGTDNVLAAKECGKEMGEHLEEEDKVLILVEDEKNRSEIIRKESFIQEMQESYPGIDTESVVEMSTIEDFSEFLSQEENIAGIFTTNDGNLSKILTFYEENEEIDRPLIYGFSDGVQDTTKADGLIIQNPYGMGYATVVASARAILEMGNEAVIDTGYTMITKESK
ncbi:ribose transport system substrate-binding protein [Aequitasia blattaphilus]|uniref:Substrate-binding domain-containing protein n=1 Tax=Aequitasia blattaphilus TaxID=2949332 RepID=A0ABT1E4X3_9FIRM|nr:substrate-binding domain-containing protein [Aequitasia blattaphilus]MCP1100891.1 substrate-binding domain-containing protein [Aequitasia blattaphilus]MCR8613531.1 substrate-binding domain-containing protein [Aequitasia blattaphilus]